MGSPSDTRITPFEEERTEHETPAGTGYSRRVLNFAGQRALAYVPDGVAPATHTAVALMCHGFADSHEWIDPAAPPSHGAASALSFVDQGWVVISHHLHGNNWGSDVAIADLLDCYVWAASTWWIDDVILLGFSMGGMTVYNALGHQALPDVAAAVTVNGVVDIRTNWLNEAYRVYGGLNETELGLYMQGHDPARDDPARWAGVPLFISSSPNDTDCPTPEQAQVFYDRAATPDVIEFRTHTRGHLAQESFMVSDVLDWLGPRVPAYDEGQSPSGTPHPFWKRDDPPPVEGESGMYLTSGAPAALFTTAGVPLDVNRAE